MTELPDTACWHTRLHQRLMSVAPPEDARTVVEDFAAAHPDESRGEVMSCAGRWAFDREKHDVAAHCLVNAAAELEEDHEIVDAVVTAVHSLRALGRIDEAFALLSQPRGVNFDPTQRARIRAARSRIHLDRGHIDKAVAEIEKARRLAFDNDGDIVSLRADSEIAEVAALVAAARGDEEVELAQWYACSAALRTVLDDGLEDEELVRFVDARLALARLHAKKDETQRAATVLDEPVNFLWPWLEDPYRIEERDCSEPLAHEDLVVPEAGADYPVYARLLTACAVERARHLEYVGRVREIVGMLTTLDETLVLYTKNPEALQHRAELHTVLGHAWRREKHCQEALESYELASRAWRSLIAKDLADGRELTAVEIDRASELNHLGRHEDAVKIFDEVLSDAREDDDESRRRLAMALDEYAKSLEALTPARCADAAAASRRAAETRLAVADEDDVMARAHAGVSLRHAAESLAHQELYDEALEEIDRALALLPEWYPTARVDALDTRATMFRFTERFVDAAEAYREAADEAESLSGDQRVQLTRILNQWALVLLEMDDEGAALEIADRAIGEWDLIDGATLRREWGAFMSSWEARGEARLKLEKYADAVEAFDDAANVAREIGSKEAQRQIVRILGRKAKALAFMGDADRALATHEERVAMMRRLAADGNYTDRNELPSVIFDRAELLELLGEDLAGAEACMVEAFLLAKDTDAPTLLGFIDRAAWWYVDHEQYGEDLHELADGMIAFYDGDTKNEVPRCFLLDLAACVRRLADAGQYATAVMLVDASLRHAGPAGADDPEAWEKFLIACRQLTRAQMQNLCARLDNNGATLRLILGKKNG